MFKRRSDTKQEQTLALIDMIGSVMSTAATSKGKGAERMEAMALVVAALGFDAKSIKSIEIDWKVIDGEYCPTLKMKTIDGIKERVQIERNVPISQRG